MTEQERITKLRAALEEIRAFTDDLTIVAIIEKALGVNESMKFGVSQREPAEVMLENSQRQKRELRQRVDELHARSLVMGDAIHRALCWFEEWLNHGGTETVTIGAEIVSNALRKAWADDSGKELLDRIKKLEAVAEAVSKLCRCWHKELCVALIQLKED